jgi:hypothetical protein
MTRWTLALLALLLTLGVESSRALACAGDGTAASCLREERRCMESTFGWFRSCNYSCGDCPVRPPHWNPGPPNVAPISAAPGAIRDTLAAAGNVIVRPFVQCYQYLSGGGGSGWACVEAAGTVVLVVGGVACSALVPGCAPVLLGIGAAAAVGTTGNCMYQCLATSDEASCQRACGAAVVAGGSLLVSAYPKLPPGSTLRPGNWIRPTAPAPPAPPPVAAQPPPTPVTSTPARPPQLTEPPAGDPWGSVNGQGAHTRPGWRAGDVDPIVRPPGATTVPCQTCGTPLPAATRGPGGLRTGDMDIAHNGMTFAQRMAYWWYWVRSGVLPNPTRQQIINMANQQVGPSCIPCNRGHAFDPPWQFPPPPPNAIPGGPPMPPGGWTVPPGVQVPGNVPPGTFVAPPAPVPAPPVPLPPPSVTGPVVLPPVSPVDPFRN